MVPETMKDTLEKLPPKQFVRIHRSYFILLNKIRVVEGNQIGLSDGTFLPVGETYRKLVGEWIEKK